jgi:hypothetical protein
MRCTAATELALSPCTHRVLACKCKALPSLAVRVATGNGQRLLDDSLRIVMHGARQLPRHQVPALS